METQLLKVIDIVKTFGSRIAVDKVSLTLFSSEVVGLVGPNGSGKSTLMKILTGHLRPSSGQIWLNGHPVQFADPQGALKRGITLVEQDDAICPDLTVQENILLGQEPTLGAGFLRFINSHRGAHLALAALKQVGAGGPPLSQRGDGLSGGQRKSVMLARALLHTPSIIVLDEAANSLGVSEHKNLLDFIKRARSEGACVVVISHTLADVRIASDRLVVMSGGRVIADEPAGEVSNEKLAMYMAGAAG